MYAQVLHECRPVTEKPLVLTEMDKPVAAAGDVLIKVHACGICRTDLHVVEGELDPGRYPLSRHRVTPHCAPASVLVCPG